MCGSASLRARGAQSSRLGPVTSRGRGILAVLVAVSCVACGTPNKLSGSIRDALALDFETTVITVQGTDLVVQYLSGGNVTCGLVVHTTAGSLQAGSVLAGKPLVAAVSLSRAARSGGHFPDVVGGALQFGAFSTTPGQEVAGQFAFELADGHTLTGAFDGTIRSLVNASACRQAPGIAPRGRRVKPSQTSSAANRKVPRDSPGWGRAATGLKE